VDDVAGVGEQRPCLDAEGAGQLVENVQKAEGEVGRRGRGLGRRDPAGLVRCESIGECPADVMPIT
jgi:hypothetical protein